MPPLVPNQKLKEKHSYIVEPHNYCQKLTTAINTDRQTDHNVIGRELRICRAMPGHFPLLRTLIRIKFAH